ncbi:MAG TPA: zf-HC2 domain-containing protein [Streptosporangiaceae bacterium]|nr:zf-HC2 domain-containing protein [Streptosporangiaceae bacterium]
MTHLGQSLSALIDGELDYDERERVLVHLARCGWCRDEVAALRALKRRMNALGEAAAGAGLTGRLIGLSNMDPGTWPSHAAAFEIAGREHRPDARVARYFLAGSFAVFLAGLGAAAFIAGGDPQSQTPAPRVTPQVGVYTVEHDDMNGLYMNGPLQPKPGRSGQDGNTSSRQP